jgi:hypothetical protein
MLALLRYAAERPRHSIACWAAPLQRLDGAARPEEPSDAIARNTRNLGDQPQFHGRRGVAVIACRDWKGAADAFIGDLIPRSPG